MGRFCAGRSCHLLLCETQFKYHCSPTIRIGTYELQIISRLLAQVHLTVGPGIPQTHPAVIYLVLEYIRGMNTATGKIHRLVP